MRWDCAVRDVLYSKRVIYLPVWKSCPSDLAGTRLQTSTGCSDNPRELPIAFWCRRDREHPFYYVGAWGRSLSIPTTRTTQAAHGTSLRAPTASCAAGQLSPFRFPPQKKNLKLDTARGGLCPPWLPGARVGAARARRAVGGRQGALRDRATPGANPAPAPAPRGCSVSAPLALPLGN